MQSAAWLNWAGIVTWLVVSLSTLADIAAGRFMGIGALAFVAAFLLFGVMLALCFWPASLFRVQGGLPALAIETACGLVMVYFGGGAEGATLVIVAAQAPYFLSPPAAWGWVVLQTAALLAIFVPRAGVLEAVSGAVAFGGFQMFAVATSMLARSERSAKEALARANAELTATRGLLAENTRSDERLRISRDLHDTLGHHLTALSLQLDVASRLASGRAAEHVLEAHAITRLLLSDVRSVVSDLRDAGPVDVAAAIRALLPQEGPLAVHLELPAALPLDDPARAQALVRSVQEIITNTTRHAAAANLWIAITPSATGIALHARDDGRGCDGVTLGNGLVGMRERFECLAGRIDVTSAAGRGFEVRGFLPSRPDA